MSRMIFVNLPVTDLARSVRFYEAIGAEPEPEFSNEKAAMMRFSDRIAVMLLTHEFYRGFTGKPIVDAHEASQVLLCLSCDSPAAVDAMVDAAAGAGGRGDPGPRQDIAGLMYGRSFDDPDGHHWEPMWMAPVAAEQGAAALDPQED